MNKRECELGYFQWEKSSLIQFIVLKGETNVEEIEEYNRVYNEILDGMTGKFISIFDATNGKWVSPKERIKFGECAKLNEEKYKDRFMTNYIVVPNAIIKMMLKGVNLVSKPKVPQKIFSKREEAVKAAEEEIMSW